MYKGLIGYLAFTYDFVARARGKMRTDDIKAIKVATHAVTDNAPQVLMDNVGESTEDRMDRAQAQLMNGHIDEMVDFLIRQEVV